MGGLSQVSLFESRFEYSGPRICRVCKRATRRVLCGFAATAPDTKEHLAHASNCYSPRFSRRWHRVGDAMAHRRRVFEQRHHNLFCDQQPRYDWFYAKIALMEVRVNRSQTNSFGSDFAPEPKREPNYRELRVHRRAAAPKREPNKSINEIEHARQIERKRAKMTKI